jgi:hypothetical protein
VAPSSSGVEISKQQGFATLDSCVKNLAHWTDSPVGL